MNDLHACMQEALIDYLYHVSMRTLTERLSPLGIMAFLGPVSGPVLVLLESIFDDNCFLDCFGTVSMNFLAKRSLSSISCLG